MRCGLFHLNDALCVRGRARMRVLLFVADLDLVMTLRLS